MHADCLLEWRILPELTSSRPSFFWDSPEGRFMVKNEPWRIIDPEGKSCSLPKSIWIDRLFPISGNVYLADWRRQILWCFNQKDRTLSEVTLPQPGDVTAMFETSSGERWLLIRSQAQLLYLGQDWSLKKRMGTRLGIASEKRLGFEWPDDAVFSHDGGMVLISDSGNNRLVRLDTDKGAFFSMPLPIRPAFILYDGPEGWLISDGADTLVWGSDRYGPLRVDSGSIMQSCRIIRQDEKLYGADETGNWGEIQVVTPGVAINSEISPARILLQLEKNEGDLNILLSNVDTKILREVLHYIPQHRTLSEYLLKSDHLQGLLPDPWSGMQEIENDAKALHAYAMGTVGEKNSEHSMVERSVLSYQIRKKYWTLIDIVREWRLLLEQLSQQTDLPEKLLILNNGIVEEARGRIRQVASDLDEQTSDLLHEKLLLLLVRYSLARSVLEELGQNLGSLRIPVFHRGLVGAIEAIDILAADIYLQKGDIARFKKGYEQAILDHPERTSLPMVYINKLFDISDLDAIEKSLSSMTNQHQEHLNARLARLYRQKGCKDKAAKHLRKELDLFPNRLELIGFLLEIADVDDTELEKRLNRALVGRHGQIDTHSNVGKIYLKRGHPEKALDHFFNECEQFPENQHSLLQIKELLFSNPEIKLEKAQSLRLWLVLRSYIMARKPGLPLPDAIIPLLFILNNLTIEDLDTAWLRQTLKTVSNPEWRCEIETWLEWQSTRTHAGEPFSRDAASLPFWLEHLSCREALAREIMETNHSLLPILKQHYPEAVPSLDNCRPLRLEYDKDQLGVRNNFGFTRAQIVDGIIYYTLEGDRRLLASPELDVNVHRTVWTFSGKEQPLCVNHQRLRTVLLWDEEEKTLKEINYQGDVLAIASFENRPRWIFSKNDGFFVFKNGNKKIVWNMWLTKRAFVEPSKELQQDWDKMYGMAYDLGLGLCRGTDSRFFSFADGVFRPLFRFDSPRLVLKAAYYWGEYDLFSVLQSYRGLTTTYLTLIDKMGEIKQRIPLPFSHVNWLGFGDKNRIFVGQLGHWLAGMEYEMTL